MSLQKTISVIVALVAASVGNGQTTWYVDGSNACPGTGSGGDPFCLIQAGIDAGSDADEVVVAMGEYFENINPMGKAITVRSTDPTIPATILATIINGANNGFSVVTCNSGEGPATVLSGFLITNGFSGEAGGMHNTNGSSPTVTHCAFSGNAASQGGGMYNDNSSPTVTNCTFSGNTAEFGAGMRNTASSSPTVTSCTFSDNSVLGFAGFGGGMSNDNSSPTVTNCTFSGNSANQGGGMHNAYISSPTVTHCTFDGNMVNGDLAGSAGGGMFNSNSSPTVTNSVICRNTPDQIFGDPIINGGGNAISDDDCVPVPTTTPLPGDLDGDGDVDLIDFGIFQSLFTGPFFP